MLTSKLSWNPPPQQTLACQSPKPSSIPKRLPSSVLLSVRAPVSHLLPLSCVTRIHSQNSASSQHFSKISWWERDEGRAAWKQFFLQQTTTWRATVIQISSSSVPRSFSYLTQSHPPSLFSFFFLFTPSSDCL